MKGAIEYLRAVRDICSSVNKRCHSCPLLNASENYVGCPREIEPAYLTDADILHMVTAPDRAKMEG